ncbi:MAG: fatty acid desaturase [Lysobacterales bacterium]
MPNVSSAEISRADLDRLRSQRWLPNLLKMPLLVGLMAMLFWIAWRTDVSALRWLAYVGIGYLWMGIVTFMHDATHNALCNHPRLNLAVGIAMMIPLFATFIAFKTDHLEHHRYNRTTRDPDAFMMGRRQWPDFLLFYAYLTLGGLLSFVHFNFIYPFQRFNRKQWAIHGFETVLKIAVYWLMLAWAERHGVLGEALALWLWPVFFFSQFNSMRFVAEHYGTPWNVGAMAGTRTVTSNRVHSFFWNNINWHIGHHAYPTVPWYNLVELHGLLEPQIAASGALVEKSQLRVYLRAIRGGPERYPAIAGSGDRGLKTEDRRPRSGDRGQKTEGTVAPANAGAQW